MSNNKYEGVSIAITNTINSKLDKLNQLGKMITEKEKQYSFLKYLQSLPITEKQVFDIYTNTTI